MKIHIQSPRQRLLDSGIVLWVNPKPPVDKLDLILETLSKQGEVKQETEDIRSKAYLNKSEVARLLGVSEKSVDAMRKKAILPKPKNIPLSDAPRGTRGKKLLRWKTQEVIEWIDDY